MLKRRDWTGASRAQASDGIRVAALLAVLTSVFAASPAHSALFIVDSISDAVDANPLDGICATVGATCTLRAAVQQANALDGEDMIILPAMALPSQYTLNLAGENEDAAATGDLDITSDVTIQGMGAGPITLQSTSTDRVFDVFPEADVTLAFGPLEPPPTIVTE